MALIFIIKMLAGTRVARLAWKYAHRLYPDKHDHIHRQRFYLRTLLSLNSSAQWFQYLDASAPLRRCAAVCVLNP
jgi:hypothetical protein